MNKGLRLRFCVALAFAVFAALTASPAQGPSGIPTRSQPWMNTSLSPDERADLVLKQMTLDEKIDLTHGQGEPDSGPPRLML